MRDCKLDISTLDISKNILILQNLFIGYCYYKLNLYDDALTHYNYIFETSKSFKYIHVKLCHLIILIYETNLDKYHNELLHIYEKDINVYLKNILEIFKNYKTQKDINDFIKKYFTDFNYDYISNSDVIFGYFKPENNDDYIFIIDRYYHENKKDKLLSLLELNIDNYIKLNALCNLIKLVPNEFDNYDKFFKIYDEIKNNINNNINNEDENIKNNINNMFSIIKKYFNDQIIFFDSDKFLHNLKYKHYFNKSNLNFLNKKYSEYLTLKEIFKDNFIEDKCIICYDEKVIIKLNCHDTHILCNDCYKKIDKCPLCRENL
jgi:hypothetical protein